MSRLPSRVPLSVRVACGALVVGVTAVLLMGVPGPVALSVIFAATGLGVGTLLVSSYTRGEEVAPSHRMASVMTMLTTCIVLGVSFGSAMGGLLSAVPERGFVLTLGAGVAGLVAAVAMHATRPESTRRVV